MNITYNSILVLSDFVFGGRQHTDLTGFLSAGLIGMRYFVYTHRDAVDYSGLLGQIICPFEPTY